MGRCAFINVIEVGSIAILANILLAAEVATMTAIMIQVVFSGSHSHRLYKHPS